VDLARLGAEFPLAGIGVVGDDEDGAWIRARLAEHGIDQQWIRTTREAPTSGTDVMSVRDTGRRTFFHNYGANALLGYDDFPFEAITARILHLAYLLVLPALDADDPEYGCVGARVLARLRAQGIVTCLDIVTEEDERVPRIIHRSLPHVDCLIVNEVEAGFLTGERTRIAQEVGSRPDPAAIRAAADRLLALGVNQLVVIHLPEGGLAVTRDGEAHFQPSLMLPPGFIKGAAGAGDAFASGILYGLHEGWTLPRMLELATATAAACLRHPTTTTGVGSLSEALDLLQQYPLREPMVA
jgi:sugar/nucleoside kinase (ribokinase family)